MTAQSPLPEPRIYPILSTYTMPTDLEFKDAWDDIQFLGTYQDRVGAVVGFLGLLDPDPEGESWERMQRDLKPFKHRFIVGTDAEQDQASLKRLAAKHPRWAKWQVEPQRTSNQAAWTVERLKQSNINAVAVYAPALDLPRATLTLVQAAISRHWAGKIHPFAWIPAAGPLRLTGYDNLATEAELVPGEQKRLVDHTRSGATASPRVWFGGQHRP